MDESERRRERLKALRNEAAQGEGSAANQAPQVSEFQSGLANPLTDASSFQQQPCSAPSRFDYYTDPLASFSANRTRGFVPNTGHVRAPPHYSEPCNQRMNMHPDPVPGPRGHQAGSPFSGSFPYRAPPFLGPRIPPVPGSPFDGSLPYRTPPFLPPVPDSPFDGSLPYRAPPFLGPRVPPVPGSPFDGSLPYRAPTSSDNPYLAHYDLPPGVENRSGRAYSCHPQQSFPRGGANFHSPGENSGMHDLNLGRGRIRSFQGLYTGRGRGNWAENKVRMGFEQNSSRNKASTEPMSKSLYQKYMVDDPWKTLKPSLWHEEKPESSISPSKTVGVKRALENSVPSISSSQSLAEYLADSFNEAVKGDSGA